MVYKRPVSDADNAGRQTIMKQSKALWSEPKLEALDVDLSSVAAGNNYYVDGSSTNNLSRNS